MTKYSSFCLMFIFAAINSFIFAGEPDEAFAQEVHEPHFLPDAESNDVRSVAVSKSGVVWAATRAGAYWMNSDGTWNRAEQEDLDGPAFAVEADPTGSIWIGQWNGLVRAGQDGRPVRIQGIETPVSVIAPLPKEGAIAFGPMGAWVVRNDGSVDPEVFEGVAGVQSAVVHDALLLIATGNAFHRFQIADSEAPRKLDSFLIKMDTSSPALRAIAFDPNSAFCFAGGMGGVRMNQNGTWIDFMPGRKLPNTDIRALAIDRHGRLWIGSALGVIRKEGDTVTLRHGRRWLVDDDVRDIAFAPDGSAWIATAAGVSAIHFPSMTLKEKANQFLDACHRRHIREPGLVEKCRLETPGDLSTFQPQDDDNDGQYTCMYLAMESYRFAATGDPEARKRARAAFHALRFLQTVTQTDGFVARTVIPSSWTRMADPNEEIGDAEWAAQWVEEPRAKRVEKRWRPSADGKWLWKGDTSSDEITGHFYGYLMFHDLAADERDKREVADHVRRVMDYIIDGGYVLRDLDGAHTRWGVWSPEKLNHDPLWLPERGINSVEILSYLKTSWHITGDDRYKQEYIRLAREEGFAANTRLAKTINPSVRTHIDDELLALAWPGLFLPMDDDDLIGIYREGFEVWRRETQSEKSPYFNFTYAVISGDADTTLEDSLFFLRDAPLDLIRWTMDNSRREDLEPSRLPEYEHIQTSRLPPPSERGVIRWDDNPWKTVQGDGGRTESDGVYWLLPYWMGRHHGFINP